MADLPGDGDLPGYEDLPDDEEDALREGADDIKTPLIILAIILASFVLGLVLLAVTLIVV